MDNDEVGDDDDDKVDACPPHLSIPPSHRHLLQLHLLEGVFLHCLCLQQRLRMVMRIMTMIIIMMRVMMVVV